MSLPVVPLTPYLPNPVLWQRGGSCQGFAAANWFTMVRQRAGLSTPELSGLYPQTSTTRVTFDVASGHWQMMLNVFMQYGAASVAAYPDAKAMSGVLPDAAADADAATRKLLDYWPVPMTGLMASADSWLVPIRSMLRQGHPIICMGHLQGDWFHPVDGVIPPLNQPGAVEVGAHQFVIFGDDPTSEHLLIVNSWGQTWGVGGCALMPYGYLERIWECCVGRVEGSPAVIFDYQAYSGPVPTLEQSLLALQARINLWLNYNIGFIQPMTTWTDLQRNLFIQRLQEVNQLAAQILATPVTDPAPAPTPTPTPTPTPIPPATTGSNVALLSLGGTCTSSGDYDGYPASLCFDGNRDGPHWTSRTNTMPVWVKRTFAAPQTISSVVVYLPNWTPIAKAITVEATVGGVKQTLGTVANNTTAGAKTVTFPAVAASDITVTITDAAGGYGRIGEIEAL